MSTATVVTLKPNSTYGIRRSTMTRYTADGFKVTAILQLDESRREGCKVYTRRWLVMELDRSPDGRRFKLTKPRRYGEDPYFVLLADNDRMDRCTCKAAEKSGWCSHLEALRGHQRAGNLPAPNGAAPE